MLNTLKTILGFLASVVEKHAPLKFGGGSIEDTYNYLKISDSLATSGQPTEIQFRLIQEHGYKTVINLAPNSALENALKTEQSLLNELGLKYIHIPVDFKNPTKNDFDTFVSSMQATSNQKVWVHCAANARVSAFVYKYRCTVLGEDEEAAKNDLQKIWEPFGVWEKFISRA
jgi:protein tyrosine phosphatase (PTP) superfamily phosphohydrolase (DUF442 family)